MAGTPWHAARGAARGAVVVVNLAARAARLESVVARETGSPVHVVYRLELPAGGWFRFPAGGLDRSWVATLGAGGLHQVALPVSAPPRPKSGGALLGVIHPAPEGCWGAPDFTVSWAFLGEAFLDEAFLDGGGEAPSQ
jgi:hypothetical protein